MQTKYIRVLIHIRTKGEVGTVKTSLSPPVKFVLLTFPRRRFFYGPFCYLCLVFVMLSCLFMAALWSPARKWLASWLSCMLCFIMFLSLSHVVSVRTHTKCGIKNLWRWLCNWNLMIFDLLTTPKVPCGGEKCAVAHPIHVGNSRTKCDWISSKGLGAQMPAACIGWM